MIDTTIYDHLDYYQLWNSYHACHQAINNYLSSNVDHTTSNIIDIREHLDFVYLEDQLKTVNVYAQNFIAGG